MMLVADHASELASTLTVNQCSVMKPMRLSQRSNNAVRILPVRGVRRTLGHSFTAVPRETFEPDCRSELTDDSNRFRTMS